MNNENIEIKKDILGETRSSWRCWITLQIRVSNLYQIPLRILLSGKEQENIYYILISEYFTHK